MMGGCAAVFHPAQGAQLLLGVDLRLSHREAGANPISQLAFTLQRFTIVEYYLAAA